MQECETSTGNGLIVKRVTVRSGGAGHAHSGVVKVSGCAMSEKALGRADREAISLKVVRLGR